MYYICRRNNNNNKYSLSIVTIITFIIIYAILLVDDVHCNRIQENPAAATKVKSDAAKNHKKSSFISANLRFP